MINPLFVKLQAHTAAGIIDIVVVQLTGLPYTSRVCNSPIAIKISRRQKPQVYIITI